MADGGVSDQQRRVRLSASMTENRVDGRPSNDTPLDFSIKRDRVTPATSSQVVVTSPPVAGPPPPTLFPQLMDPALVTALSAAGLLLPAAKPTTATPSPLGDVTEKVRAYVQSKIAEEQRRLTQSSSSSSPSADSSVERAMSPLRSSPTSTTTPSPSVGFDALSPRWPVTPLPLSSAVSEESPVCIAATGGGRKRGSSYTETSTTKDTHYWERRRKNNEAAKRSRDARRAKEEEVAVRASMLEQENRQLRVELTAFRLEVARLSELLCRQVAQRSSAPTAGAPGTPQDNSPR